MKILKVSGDYYDCGEQIGTANRAIILEFIESIKSDLPSNVSSWSQLVELAQPYYDITQIFFPKLIEEINGTARGCNVTPAELFTTLVEELWQNPSKNPVKGCTDVILTPPLTTATIVGHNNDLSPFFRDKMTAVIREYSDGSSLFTVGPCGYYVSVGVNSHGITLTGNQLFPIDNKIGIPRSIIARAILTAQSFEEAVSIANFENRASSYNNIISTVNRSVCVEGSATASAMIQPEQGKMVHANHYISHQMEPYEGIGESYQSSFERQKRIGELVDNLTIFNSETVKSILRSHYPDLQGSKFTVCRHSELETTVFSIVIDMGKGLVDLAMGHPCVSEYEHAWIIPDTKNEI